MNRITLLKSMFALVLLAMLPSITTAATETITWIHTDHLGSSIAGRNAAGETTWEQAYAPWGEKQAVAGVLQAPAGVGYTGHVYDEKVGLIYAGARWYDPAMGRFLSPDSVRFTAENYTHFNRYMYASNNAYIFVDPDGRKVVIVGGKKFQKDVRAQIGQLNATPTGKKIVETLEKSERIFAIFENSGSSFATPYNPENAQNGIGSDGKIMHDPNWSPKVNTPDGPAATPPAVVLGHELSHAVDYDKGTLDRGVNPTTGVRRAEEKAVRVENRLRKEMDLPTRAAY